MVSGEAISHADGMAAAASSGLKLKNVAATTSAPTGPMAADRDAK